MIEGDNLDLGSMPSDWSVSDIQNETLFVTDFVANGSFASLAENVNYKNEPDYAVLIRLTDFNNGFKGEFVYVDEHAYNFLSKSKLAGGEIIISNVGAYAGTTFLAPRLNRPMTLGPNAIMMNFKSGNEFYFYWFKSPVGKFLLDGIISGSAQPKFNKTTFRQLKVPVPPLEEQKAIASVLSSLDDKIELLHRQNTTLETMSETLFRQWFVEEAQDDWAEYKISDFADHLKQGVNPAQNPFVEYHHYSLPAFDENQRPVFEIGSEILSNKYRVLENTILVSKLNPRFPRIWPIQRLPSTNAVCSTEFQVFKPKQDNLYAYLYFLLGSSQARDALEMAASGTSGSHQRVRPEDMLNITTQLPSIAKAVEFAEITWTSPISVDI